MDSDTYGSEYGLLLAEALKFAVICQTELFASQLFCSAVFCVNNDACVSIMRKLSLNVSAFAKKLITLANRLVDFCNNKMTISLACMTLHLGLLHSDARSSFCRVWTCFLFLFRRGCICYRDLATELSVPVWLA
jgi:hypothetical protein